MSLFESFAIFGLFDAESCKQVDYLIANKPQIMQTLFVGYLLPNNPNNASNPEKSCGEGSKFLEIKQTLFVVICRLFVDTCRLLVIVGRLLSLLLRTHPISSSQRGTSAEFQLRVEAPQHVGDSALAPRSLRAAASLLVASTHSAGAVSGKRRPSSPRWGRTWRRSRAGKGRG